MKIRERRCHSWRAVSHRASEVPCLLLLASFENASLLCTTDWHLFSFSQGGRNDEIRAGFSVSVWCVSSQERMHGHACRCVCLCTCNMCAHTWSPEDKLPCWSCLLRLCLSEPQIPTEAKGHGQWVPPPRQYLNDKHVFPHPAFFPLHMDSRNWSESLRLARPALFWLSYLPSPSLIS